MAETDRNQLDQWLDSAMKQYGNVEPRPGLEKRIMANLEARNRSRERARFALGIISAVTACVLVVGVWFARTRRSGEKIARSSVVSTEIVGLKSAMTQPAPVGRRAKHSARKSVANVNSNVAGNTPRQEQFPAARPLSEQERLLIAYVNDFPKEAAEVAKEQTAWMKDLEAKYPTVNSESDFQEER